MTVDDGARLIPLSDGRMPRVADGAWVAPGAVLAGAVTLLDGASVWYNAVLRAEAEPIVIGAGSNLQDGVVCHVDHGFPLTVGSGVSVGHGAVLHGCTIGDDVLVGMSATVLNGAVVGDGSLLAAGTVVLEGAVIPPGSLVAGVPGKVRRALTDDELAGIRANADAYLHHVTEHRG
ncbi:gamma carbonic anhydrase family protein [Diaminobutyricibacter sp. McL0608]|uniref:gamma carbonic anhydrase family protein n=1 Tax=Leifsonia sp. McL0608 TaxID=3143537 RepID=UPI0031F2F2BE